MISSYKDGRVAVYDDFLSVSEHEELLRYLDGSRFRNVLPEAWGRAYRLTNGDALVGTEVLSAADASRSDRPVYPTGTALDAVIRRLWECAPEVAGIVGSYGEAWTYFTVCPYVYPPGTGLGWHTDPHCKGAFVYYAHADWSHEWGGELLVEHSTTDTAAYSSSCRGFVRNNVLEAALQGGLGYYFAAKPNRAIFLRSRTPHKVNSVAGAAGDRVRLSISGFFLGTHENRC